MSKLVITCTLLAVALLGTPARALAADFTVGSSGQGSYRIKVEPDGVPIANPALTLTRGKTYTFDVVVGNHPFLIKTVREIGNGDTYDNGVTNNGASPGLVTFAVPADAPSLLYYQCQYHDPMNGELNIVSAPIEAASVPATSDASGALLGGALAVLGVALLGSAGVALQPRRRTA